MYSICIKKNLSKLARSTVAAVHIDSRTKTSTRALSAYQTVCIQPSTQYINPILAVKLLSSTVLFGADFLMRRVPYLLQISVSSRHSGKGGGHAPLRNFE